MMDLINDGFNDLKMLANLNLQIKYKYHVSTVVI